MRYNSFFPNGRWFAGLLLMFTVYVSYAFMGPIIEGDLVDTASDAGVGQYGMTVIRNTVSNYWIGTLVLMGGLLFYLIIAGLPGQQEERWERYL